MGRWCLFILIAVCSGAPLVAQVSGTVLDDSGRVDNGAFVELAGGREYLRVQLSSGRFVFRDVRDTGPLWVEAFHGSRFSSRVRVSPSDTALRLVLEWPARTGLTASRTLFTGRVQDREFAAGGIQCEGPACDLRVPDTVGTVFCWSTILGARQDTAVEHVWYWRDREVARVRLTVRGPRWRTWSSKRIDRGRTGTWRVDVVTLGGALLAERVLMVESSRDEITREDLAYSQADNAYDVIQRLHIRWLSDGARGSRVYVDGVDRGTNWAILYQIPRDTIAFIRWRGGVAPGGRLDVTTLRPD